MSVLHKNISCDPTSESSRDGSDEGSQHMVSVGNKKNSLNYLQIVLLTRALMKVKVTLEGQMIKWSQIEFAITSTFIHGFQNNLALTFSLRSRSAI